MSKDRRAIERRHQAKLARDKQKSQVRRRRREEPKMSRADDLAYVGQQLQALNEERQRLVTEYNAYHQKIQGQIEKILREAEVWDVLQALEAGREKRRTEGQATVNEIGVQIADLEKVRAFLASREAAAVPDPASPAVPEVQPDGAGPAEEN